MEKLRNLSRRTFLKGGAVVGGGLVIGLYLPGIARLTEVQTTSDAPFAPNVSSGKTNASSCHPTRVVH